MSSSIYDECPKCHTCDDLLTHICPPAYKCWLFKKGWLRKDTELEIYGITPCHTAEEFSRINDNLDVTVAVENSKGDIQIYEVRTRRETHYNVRELSKDEILEID